MTSVIPIWDYLRAKEEERKQPNIRLEGLKLLKEAGLSIPEPIIVITSKTFESFRTSDGKFADNEQEEMRDAFEAVMHSGISDGVAVRRIYDVPFYEGRNPSGPRSPKVTNFAQMISELKKIFGFAIRAEYSEQKGAEIAAFIHPFIDPLPPRFGGNIYSTKSNLLTESFPEGILLIEALYGNDEGTLALPHDDIWIDYKTGQSFEKTKMVKEKCIRLGERVGAAHVVKVPAELRETDVVQFHEQNEIVQEVRRFYDKYGMNYRLEFDWPASGLYFIEAANVSDSEFLATHLSLSGRRIHIPSHRVLRLLSGFGAEREQATRVLEGIITVVGGLFNKRPDWSLKNKQFILFDTRGMDPHAAAIMELDLIEQIRPTAIILLLSTTLHPLDMLLLHKYTKKIQNVISLDTDAKQGDKVRIHMTDAGDPVLVELSEIKPDGTYRDWRTVSGK